MQKKYRILILSDHRIHSPVESIYSIANALKLHSRCLHVHAVSRGLEENQAFFEAPETGRFYAISVNPDFRYHEDGRAWTTNPFPAFLEDYDVVFLRLSRRNSIPFFEKIEQVVDPQRIINQPQGIIQTGSKSFLMEFPEVCPPMKLCYSVADVEEMRAQFAIVLKPFNSSGGRGLVRIDGDEVETNGQTMTWNEFLPELGEIIEEGYLAMKFMENVGQGDKRVIVVNGKIIAAALRVPREGHWLCNVSQGAKSELAEPDEAELEIAERITPELMRRGVVYFGFDTLMGDDGKRILSEINTSCINGIYPAEVVSGKPIVKRTAKGFWTYILKHIKPKNQKLRPEPIHLRELNLHDIPRGEIARFWVQLATNGIGMPISVPVMVAKGANDGPVMGLTAAVHGNELNGLPVIQRLFSEINAEELTGTIVGVLVANVPGFLRGERRFNDMVDPNHIMPGVATGNNSQLYVHRLMDRIIRHFDYLIDLHTASFGRVNSYYIRADMNEETMREMALLQNADIIVHNPPHDGTLRGAAEDMNIPAITLEVGDPNRFQRGMIRSSLTGIHNALIKFGFLKGDIDFTGEPVVLCERSYWLYTQMGGILTVLPSVTDRVKKGELVGTMRNIFGDVVKEYFAPEDGIVIGKSVNPVTQSGGRILHLGIPYEGSE